MLVILFHFIYNSTRVIFMKYLQYNKRVNNNKIINKLIYLMRTNHQQHKNHKMLLILLKILIQYKKNKQYK